MTSSVLLTVRFVFLLGLEVACGVLFLRKNSAGRMGLFYVVTCRVSRFFTVCFCFCLCFFLSCGGRFSSYRTERRVDSF